MAIHRIKRGTPFWERGERRLVVPALGPCLEWRGARHPAGYGEFRENGKLIRAHVRAFELVNGPLGRGLLVRHHCDNPPCFEPTHLASGTRRDNAQDAVDRGRLFVPPSGDESPFAKVTNAQIAQARQLRGQGWLLREIAELIGVEESYCSRLCRGVVRP